MSGGLQGFRAWLLQRLTAVFLVIGSLMLVILVLFPPADNYESWKAWMEQPLTIVAIGLFSISQVLHAWVGVRDVVVDYVHPLGLRLMVLALSGVYLLGNLIWLLWILL